MNPSNSNIPIAKPPWTGLGKKMESTLRRALYDFQMIQNPGKIAVALSGGKDSLALLFLLHAISGRGIPELEIYAIHVTGEFSCGAGINTNYLKAICEILKIPFITRESTQKLESLECYSCSKERRTLIFDAAKELGIDTIAFGHHRDDNAQTLLMNLLHKGEFAGMLPKIYMYEYGVTIIRPLIYIGEEDIQSFAKAYQFSRIMCRCPVGQHSMRKKVDQLLTDIEALYPNARENIARAAIVYGSDKAAKGTPRHEKPSPQ